MKKKYPSQCPLCKTPFDLDWLEGPRKKPKKKKMRTIKSPPKRGSLSAKTISRMVKSVTNKRKKKK